jgi:hypothetical protein
MSSSTYTKKKLYEAVRSLATRDDSLKGRLADAAVYLVHLRPMLDGIAPEHRDKLMAILDSLTKEPPVAEEGAITATVQKMTDQEAGRTAEAILGLFTDLLGGLL